MPSNAERNLRKLPARRKTPANRNSAKRNGNDGMLTPLAKQLVAGDRRALARAITLIESTRPDHRAEAERLLEMLLPHTGKSIRIGISGVPGVGKSTFIEAFGLQVIAQKHRVAVLAIDPSSRRGGGSILGDKTRMAELGASPEAFIRPSPSGGSLNQLLEVRRPSVRDHP